MNTKSFVSLLKIHQNQQKKHHQSLLQLHLIYCRPLFFPLLHHCYAQKDLFLNQVMKIQEHLSYVTPGTLPQLLSALKNVRNTLIARQYNGVQNTGIVHYWRELRRFRNDTKIILNAQVLNGDWILSWIRIIYIS